MKAKVSWFKDLSFVGESASGHAVTMSAGSNSGGRDSMPTPMEMVLMAVGGCSSIDVVMILKKGRQHVLDCVCELDSERAETSPKVFRKIHAKYIVTGKQLKPDQVERAVSLSLEKYCSVALMLKDNVEITSSFEIIEASDD
ncbi:OsmC family protein [Permianibacter aggregans]|uniref:Putative redox protein n=1 Tax=Permianibacter aggregans TaxID=1510150 RepID=A0A4R6UPX0_9GAMM|nr:OsmC family protein [Permianibacter aggregans]QGX39073.1 OsmC family protein [Permianibacter aggregans]TDQ47719.1 putative redox protein [Permianibacter aggregans]